ncbi:FGGY-family carbohydrate kinase [Methylovirgula sp. 4M-Z18]|uniref:FGGY-family carbohydrate kinase n=1 Tax=Methylovirgula sp. 4M-Z18 TaxID=2293567 RepID=UPI000E2EA001|nr:FGGY-family carbohydrate kinase [Methylovirgula sp. 4M-Z18]RFB76304.1 ribulokinase [Methylovirgula sp. 4M-Z18]
MRDLIAAVDVGTRSARAGILDTGGTLLGRAVSPISLNFPRANYAEHDSEQIWSAIGLAMREAIHQARIDPARVAGLSFDATCSLVIRDVHGNPLNLSPSQTEVWDTLVWLDHRALKEAEECTASKHRLLNYIGGVMSPEMETPKLMWLKRRRPDIWAKIGYLFDLADFLTWKASGQTHRSQCTLTCKWAYLGHQDRGWQKDLLDQLGIADMLECGHLPEHATPIGQDLGTLTAEAAQTLGLTRECRVGVGLIDAHAGMLGVLGGLNASGTMERHLGLIAGTSSCVMALSQYPIHTPGIWGPYYGAVLPDCWLNEGGQSATGALLDHIIRSHGAGLEPTAETHTKIVARVQELRAGEGEALAQDLHVLPDFHGNRSPLANPHALGVISGLNLDSSFDALCRLYWRTLVGIALGIRHILEALNDRGYIIDTLHVSGGHTKNPLLMELYADATGCAVVESLAEDTVLLGTAMVAATAAGLFPDLSSACRAMRQQSRTRAPNLQARARFDRDYRIFLRMHEHRQEIETLGLAMRE